MSNEFSLNAQARDVTGKGSSRRLRRLEGNIPAIVYGGKKDPQNITLAHKDIIKATENEAFFAHIIDLNIDGNPESVIVKDMQRHPAKPVILHVDFLRVSKDVAIHVNVPLHFINEDACKGVKEQGGAISHNISEVEISCLPGDLPESIDVDMTNVEIDQIVHLSDLALPKGVTLMAFAHGGDEHEHDLPVVSIHAPKVAEEPEAGAPEAPEAPEATQQADEGAGEE
ncbi:MAG: 50S ribosomal protein L25/general stress protein Ctc [Pseudomonadales bacterium]